MKQMEGENPPLEAKLIEIADKAWKLWKSHDFPISAAIEKACDETVGGNERLFEVSAMFRKVGGRFGNLRTQRRSHRKSSHQAACVYTQAA